MSGLAKLTYHNNKEEIVRRLQNGADVNEQDSNGLNALFRACRDYHTELVEILLKHNKINVNLQDSDGYSPFSYACWSDSYDTALIMLQDPRVDVNMADDWGMSPLMWACYTGYTKIVQFLISFGRNIDILKKSTKDWRDIKSGSTTLDLAKQTNKTTVVKLLQQYQNNPKETQKTTRNKLNIKGKK